MVRRFIVAVFLWLAGSFAVFADPEAFVTTLGADLRAAAAAGEGETAALLDQRFDITAMAFAALPEAFRERADRAYVAAYRAHVSREFVTELKASGEGEMRVLGSRSAGEVILVGAETLEDGRRTFVEFYLRAEGASYRVLNVAVEGMLITNRQSRDFSPILISGDMPGLIAYLTKADR